MRLCTARAGSFAGATCNNIQVVVAAVGVVSGSRLLCGLDVAVHSLAMAMLQVFMLVQLPACLSWCTLDTPELLCALAPIISLALICGIPAWLYPAMVWPSLSGSQS